MLITQITLAILVILAGVAAKEVIGYSGADYIGFVVGALVLVLPSQIFKRIEKLHLFGNFTELKAVILFATLFVLATIYTFYKILFYDRAWMDSTYLLVIFSGPVLGLTIRYALRRKHTLR